MKPFIGKPYNEIKNIQQWVDPAKRSIDKWKNIITLDYYSDAAIETCGLCIKASSLSDSDHPFMCRDSGCPLYCGDNERINMNCCYHHDEMEEVFDLDDLLCDDVSDGNEIEIELVRLCEVVGKRLIMYLEELILYAESESK